MVMARGSRNVACGLLAVGDGGPKTRLAIHQQKRIVANSSAALNRKVTMKISQFVSSVALALMLDAGFASAQTALYTFESPQWVVGAPTPFLNMSPDSAPGLPTFRASFTSSPTAGAIIVGTLLVNPSFSGKDLYQPAPPFPGNTLTITVSQPIRSVHLDFEQFAPGHFDLTSTAGTASTSTVTQIGSLDFQSTTSFTQFSLAAFDTGNSPIPLGIDNLVMTVPEPSSLAMVGLGAAALMVARRRR